LAIKLLAIEQALVIKLARSGFSDGCIGGHFCNKQEHQLTPSQARVWRWNAGARAFNYTYWCTALWLFPRNIQWRKTL